ncbi:hypothetical protein J6590_049099 [Homalodisca vitripennis]|nr:hypothetical protein J6590_049099 [Homalodisca vitripennis]
MVVLESASGSVGLLEPHPPASAPMVVDSATSATPSSPRSTLKIVPKRFINLHSWLGPICAKSLKEFMPTNLFTNASFLAHFFILDRGWKSHEEITDAEHTELHSTNPRGSVDLLHFLGGTCR